MRPRIPGMAQAQYLGDPNGLFKSFQAPSRLSMLSGMVAFPARIVKRTCSKHVQVVAIIGRQTTHRFGCNQCVLCA